MAIPEPIESFLLRLGFDYESLPAGQPTAQPESTHESAWTTTRVFMGGPTPILAMHARDRRIHPQRLQQLAALPAMREATHEELAQLYPFAEPGSTPPLGPLYGHPVFVDEGLAAHEHVMFAAGTPAEMIRMRYRDFVALVQPVVGSFTESRSRVSTGPAS
jgi:prolyl-tRNA editing enzyme YbaK/EbsC (Cys-tRNA(Pro) deacylase)